MDHERTAREIAATGRAARKRPPRWLWAIAIVVGLVCVVPLAHAWLTTSATATTPAERPVAGSGLGTGIALGFVAGAVVGFAVARANGRR